MNHRLTSSLLLSTIIVFAFSFSIVYSAARYGDASSDVAVLTARDVNVLLSGEAWLTNQCPNQHPTCQKFAPEFERVASLLKGKINVGVIEDGKEQDANFKFPKVTLHMSHATKRFDGEKDAATILRWTEENLAGIYGGKTSNVRVVELLEFETYVLNKGQTWLINFCPKDKAICQKLEPVYEKVASLLKEEINVGAVFTRLHHFKDQATRFPTVKLYRGLGKKPITFRGKRNVASLIRFVEESSVGLNGGKASRVEVLTAENFQRTVVDSNEKWLIIFCPDDLAICQDFASVYERDSFTRRTGIVAKINFGKVVDERFAKDQQITSFPTVIFYRGLDMPPISFDGPRDSTSLLRFIEYSLTDFYAPKSSPVKLLTGEDFQSKVVDSKENWLINFCPDGLAICQRAALEIIDVASFIKGQINVGAVTDDRFFPTNKSFTKFPTVILYMGSEKEPITYNGNLFADDLLRFFNKSTGYLDGGDVVILTAEDFQRKLGDSKEKWLINFCPDDLAVCQEVAYDYKRVASLLKSKVKVGVVVDEVVAKNQRVTSFPTVELYLGELEQPVRYNPFFNRDKYLFQSICDFVKEQLKAQVKRDRHSVLSEELKPRSRKRLKRIEDNTG